MASSTSLSHVESDNRALNALSILPGILLLAGIGYAAKALERTVNTYAKTHHWIFPNIEYVLWAILIGLVISNTLRIPKIFQSGIDTYEFLLKLGIVLLGARFVLADVLKLGGISLALVVIEITLSLALMTFLGKLFKLKLNLISLLATRYCVWRLRHHRHQGRHRCGRRRFLLCHCRNSGARRTVIVHISGHRSQPSHE